MWPAQLLHIKPLGYRYGTALLLLLLGWHNLRLLLHFLANKKNIKCAILVALLRHSSNHAMQDSWDNPKTMTV
jgi:hypothetical protein